MEERAIVEAKTRISGTSDYTWAGCVTKLV